MPDPWDAAAARKTEASQQAKATAANEAKRLKEEKAAKQVQQEAAFEALKAAIEVAIPLLERFMRERGEAAKRLLAASGDRAYIHIGGESEGGYYHSYYLSKDGLRYETGRSGGYSSTPENISQASVRSVVESFAREGGGRRDPAKVRKIVDWLTDQVNQYA